MSPRKKAAFIFLALLLGAAAVALPLEILARVKGYKPWKLYDPGRIKIQPPGSFYQVDPELGFKHRPGRFRLAMPDGYTFEVTHGADTLRQTHSGPVQTGKPALWIFGCSLTHGWALNDNETYPWVLQEKLPGFEIVNFGVGGYNTFQSLAQLKQALLSREKPQAVILAYASMHDERNASLRSWKRALVTYNGHNEMLSYPYGYFDEKGQLQVSRNRDVHFNIPPAKFSAAAFFLETLMEKQQEKKTRAADVSKAAILWMDRVCRQEGVHFIVAGIDEDAKTRIMLEFCRARGIKTASCATTST